MLMDSFFLLTVHLQMAPITRQFGKCAVSQSSAKIISSIQSKRFTCSYSKKYYIRTLSYFIKFLINKEITRFAWSKQQQKSWTDVTIDHLSRFLWSKTVIFL